MRWSESEGRRLRPLWDGLKAAGLGRAAVLPIRGGLLDFVGEFLRLSHYWRGEPNCFEPSPFWRVYKRCFRARHPGPAMLHDLFVLGRRVCRANLERLLGPTLVDLGLGLDLLDEHGDGLSSSVCLATHDDLLLMHDWPSRCMKPGYVYMGRASIWFVEEVRRVARQSGRVARVLDVGTGNGCAALAMRDLASSVIGTDIDERILDFARASAAANGVEDMEYLISDVYDSVSGAFDLILSNMPQGLDDREEARMGMHDRGGVSFRQRLLRGGLDRLTQGGVLVVGFSTPLSDLGWHIDEELREIFSGMGVRIHARVFLRDYWVEWHPIMRSLGAKGIARGIMTIRRADAFSMTREIVGGHAVRSSVIREQALRLLASVRQ